MHQMALERMKKTHGPGSRLFLQLNSAKGKYCINSINKYIYTHISIYQYISYADTFLEACHVLRPLHLPTRGVSAFFGFGSLQTCHQVNLRGLPRSKVLSVNKVDGLTQVAKDRRLFVGPAEGI